MIRGEGHHEFVGMNETEIEPFVGRLDRRQDRCIELAREETSLDDLRFRDLYRYVEARELAYEPAQQRRERVRFRPHADAERQRSHVIFPQPTRVVLRGFGGRETRLKVRQHHASEIGQMRVRALATKQETAQFSFQLLDGAGQRGLSDTQLLGGLREVEAPRSCEEVTDLMHFHVGLPVPGPYSSPQRIKLLTQGQ